MRKARNLPHLNVDPAGQRPRAKGKKAKSYDLSTKQKRYRRRKVAENVCPHCGKLCAPYYACHDRRYKKRMCYILNRMADLGEIRKIGQGRGIKFAAND